MLYSFHVYNLDTSAGKNKLLAAQRFTCRNFQGKNNWQMIGYGGPYHWAYRAHLNLSA